MSNQRGLIKTLPLLMTLATVGIITFLLISSSLPFNGSFNSLFPKKTSHAATQVTVTVDGNNIHQTILGFGATNIPLWGWPNTPYPTGNAINDDLRKRAIETVYNQVKITTGQLENTLLEASAPDMAAVGNDNDDPKTINWAGFQTAAVDFEKSKLLDLASPYGFTDYLISAKIDTQRQLNWLVNLKATSYQSYLQEISESVLANLLYWKNTYGITTPYTMLFNEPLSGNNEIVGGNTPELVDIIKTVGARIRTAGFTTKFVVTNEETIQAAYQELSAILADPQARQYIGAIGYHAYPYGSTYNDINKILSTSGAGKPDSNEVAIRNQMRDLGKLYGLPIWLTEISSAASPFIADPLSFDDLRGRAIHIHDEFEYADASAYYGMLNMWDSNTNFVHHGTNSFSGEESMVLIDIPNNKINITGIGYAVGHFARWINKGALRIDAQSSDPLLLVSAFKDSKTQKAVFVLINNDTQSKTISLTANNLTFFGTLTGEQSTQNTRWQPITSFSPDASMISTNLPALSVTTLAVPIGAGPSVSPIPSSTPFPSLTPTFTPAPITVCPLGPLGDIDCNGKIDLFDYNILVGNFSKTVPFHSMGDLDGNGVVNLFDYNILVTNFGKGG